MRKCSARISGPFRGTSTQQKKNKNFEPVLIKVSTMTSKKRSRPSSSLSEEEAHDIPEGNPVLKLIEKFNIYAACKEFLEPAKSEVITVK